MPGTIVRYVLLGLSRILGGFLRLWKRRAAWAVFPAVLMILVANVVLYAFGDSVSQGFKGILTAFSAPAGIKRNDLFPLILTLGLFAIVVWIARSRSRMVVGTFTDYRSLSESPASQKEASGSSSGGTTSAASGLGNLLVAELGSLHRLYRVVDRTRAVPDAVKGHQNVSFDEQRTLDQRDDEFEKANDDPLVLPAPIMAEDVMVALDSVVSVESTIKVGPVNLPIGAMASLVSRIARGPRITGSLHQVGDELTLTARTVGARANYQWKVTRGSSKSGAMPAPETLVEELAIRIFSDLSLRGSVKWRAAQQHVAGLRRYRECVGTRKDRRTKLEEAKDAFIQTIAEDDGFDLAYYNLGVVTTDLRQFAAAEDAFRGAIGRNDRRWEPHYGLAQLYFEQERFEEMVVLCDRMLQLKTRRAETYHLQAVAYRKLGRRDEAMKAWQRAVWWAWLRLCLAARRRNEPEVCGLAATSLRNLGTMRAYVAKDKRFIRRSYGYFVAERELRQGIFLTNTDAELHFELGKVLAAGNEWTKAARRFRKAVILEPDRPRYLVQLARACAKRPGKASMRTEALAASARALEQPSQMTITAFERLATAERDLGNLAEAERIAALKDFEGARRKWSPDSPPNADLERQLKGLNPTAADGSSREQAVWQLSQVALELAERYIGASDARPQKLKRIAEHLENSLDLLKQRHAKEVQRHDVSAIVAEAFLKAGLSHSEPSEQRSNLLGRALEAAESAVLQNPLSCKSRTVLARAHLALEHLDLAKKEWEKALVCNPDSPQINLAIGECLVRSGLRVRGGERRTELLGDARRYLEDSLELYELVEAPVQGRRESKDDFERRCLRLRKQLGLSKGRARFWLGRAHFELDEYEKAAASFQLANALEFKPHLARLYTGISYVRTGAVCEGERELQDLLAELSTTSLRPETCLGTPEESGERVTVKELAALAEINIVASLTDRDARLEQNLVRLGEVKKRVGNGAVNSDVLLANIADVEGWTRFRLNKELEEILQCLKDSIEKLPSAEAYLHLALVHAECSHRKGEDCSVHQKRARDFARLATRMGLAERQQVQLDDALRMLAVRPGDQAVNEGAQKPLAGLASANGSGLHKAGEV